MKQILTILTKIAELHLNIPTLRTRRSDQRDFHDVSVWAVRSALRAAYDAGVSATLNTLPPKPPTADRPIVAIRVEGGLIEDLDATIPVHVVIEDWDITDDDTGKKPARSVWTLTGGLSGAKAEKLRRLAANV